MLETTRPIDSTLLSHWLLKRIDSLM